MKFEDMEGTTNKSMSVAFVKITKLEKAQQTTISLKELMHIGRLCEVLEKLGFETVTITVEKDMPLLIGKRNIGIAISARED